LPDNRPAVLQVTPALDAGGVERTTIEIAAALARAGFRPLVASAGGRLEPELQAVGGTLIRRPLDSKAPHTIIANAFRLAGIIRTQNVKLVHARSRAPAWSALRAARMTHVPFVTTYHGIYNASNALKRFYNSVMVRGAAVIANSQWTADHIREEYRFKPKRLAVIPRGVDLAQFDPGGIAPDRTAKLRAQWDMRPADVVVLLPGRLTRWKGQRVLIDAMVKLAQENALGNFRAVLIGDAQGRHEYESELQDAITKSNLHARVQIQHHLADMPAAYLASDIVVSASTDPEAFGRVAAEASAMGRPVIATDHGGARETVLRGVSGLLVPPGDAAALASALQQLVAIGPDARDAMGAKGRAHIAARYTVDRMCADTIALYRELLAQAV
jgi:glycosyltransferase involved in cell wall biosynthesis